MPVRNIHTSLCLHCFSLHKTTFLFFLYLFFSYLGYLQSGFLVREKAFAPPVCSWLNHQNDKVTNGHWRGWDAGYLAVLQSSSLQVGEWAIKRDSSREGKRSFSMWDVLKHAGGVFSDVIKTQSWMQDKWIAPHSCWVTSVVEWRVCAGWRRYISLAHQMGKKTTTRTIKVRGGRLTLKASLQHQWPLRLDGRERAELTENIQRGRCITGLWPGDVVCVVPGSLSVHDLLKSCCSSPKNTVSLTATWIMLTRTYQKHLWTRNAQHCHLFGLLLEQWAVWLRSLLNPALHQDL